MLSRPSSLIRPLKKREDHDGQPPRTRISSEDLTSESLGWGSMQHAVRMTNRDLVFLFSHVRIVLCFRSGLFPLRGIDTW